MVDGAPSGRPGVAPAELRAPRPRWLRRYIAVLVVLDAVAMAVATLTAKISWLGINPEELEIRGFSIPYLALVLITVPTWLVLLALAGAYDLGPFGGSTGSWTRIVRAGAQLLAVVAVAYYIAHLATLGRGVLAGTIPLAVVLTLGGRAVAGAGLSGLRRRGRARRRALLLGSRRSIDAFLAQLDTAPGAGVDVVGLQVISEPEPTAPPSPSTPRHEPSQYDGQDGEPLAPTTAGRNGTTHTAPGTARSGPQPHPLAVSAALARSRAETLIVTGGLAQGRLRDIAWLLEGTGVELLVTPTPADAENLRSEIRPVAGLPLLYLDR
ncbi:MAG TPA: hypothetical protein VFZ79_15060 [Acidimicrobiales bacterium]